MSLFLDVNKDLILFHSLNEELIDVIIDQSCVIYTINGEQSTGDPLYGESLIKLYNPGVTIKGLIEYEDPDVTTTLESGGINRRRVLNLFLHRKSLIDDNIFFQEGDLIDWDDQFYEITKVIQPKKIQGQDSITWDVIVNAIGTPIKTIKIIEE